MAKLKLYQYAILRHVEPSKVDREAGASTKTSIVQEPKMILVKDEAQAMMVVSREIPVELMDNLDEVEVLIRPF